jgi:hypothetical protein
MIMCVIPAKLQGPESHNRRLSAERVKALGKISFRNMAVRPVAETRPVFAFVAIPACPVLCDHSGDRMPSRGWLSSFGEWKRRKT